MNYIIETESLTKVYGDKIALDHVNMHIEKGDIYGFIGRNGAGKTTAMKLILNLSFPTEGTIKLFGESATDKSREKIGSLIESPALYKKESAYENLRRFGILYGASKKDIDEVLEIVNLTDTGKKKAGEFSLGMKQRLGIAIALLGNPDILILDEPVNGLDPAATKQIRDSIIRINEERNVTFLISSHLLGELSKISNKYGIINNGQLVEEVNASELESRTRSSLDIKCKNIEVAAGILQSSFGVDIKNPKETELIKDQELIRIFTDLDNKETIINKIANTDAKMYDFHTSILDMEDYFIERI